MFQGLKRLLKGRKSSHAEVSQAQQPDEVVKSLAALPALEAQVEFLRRCKAFRVDQMRPEFTEFLTRVRDVRPKRILEIGGRRGGSVLLMSMAAPDAQIVSLDIDYGRRRLRRLRQLCDGRSVEFWQGDSQESQTVDRVREWLADESLDVLFIDGDHRLQGALQDFQNYLPLVRNQGLIALHDIQSDYSTRFSVNTLSWSGGVPQLWTQIRKAGFRCEDLISDEWQDGYGIGVVTRSPEDPERLKTLVSATEFLRAA